MNNNFPRFEITPELRHKMIEVARKYRKAPTASEYILWQALRGKKLDDIKFRRQQPVGMFIVDFYNSAYRLVVEIDGGIHDNQEEADRAQQDILEAWGLNVLRIKSEMAEKNLPAALEMIRTKIRELKSYKNAFPFHALGEGGG